jgi:hypothetical protein
MFSNVENTFLLNFSVNCVQKSIKHWPRECLIALCYSLLRNLRVRVCVCVKEREKEKECGCVCVCLCAPLEKEIFQLRVFSWSELSIDITPSTTIIAVNT